jgi:hypothetical protein
MLIEPPRDLGEVLVRNLVHDLHQHAHHLDVVHGFRPVCIGPEEQEVPPVLTVVDLPLAMGVVAVRYLHPTDVEPTPMHSCRALSILQRGQLRRQHGTPATENRC